MTGILGSVLGSSSASKPSTPNVNSATNVGTNRPFDNGAASVSFSLPAGSPPATSFTASGFCSRHNTNHTATGASSPLTVEGFGSDIDVVFTVTATNAAGTSAASAGSSSIKITTVPARINAPTVTSSASQDTVSWSAPSSGGSPITLYRWTSSDGKTGTTTNTSVVVNQEANTSQTYQVRAENLNGSGIYSLDSNSITTPPFFPPFFPYFPFFPFFPPFFPPYFQPSCSGCDCCSPAWGDCGYCYVPGTCFCDD